MKSLENRHLESFPFGAEVGVRHTDLDLQKCINNVALADIFEEARTQFSVSRKLKGAFDPHRRVIEALTIAFGQDGCYPGSVDVYVGVEAIADRSWTLRLVAAQNGQIIAANDCTFRLLNDEGQAVPLPAALVGILEQD